MERWLERVGYGIQWLGDAARDRVRSLTDTAADLAGEMEAPDLDLPEEAETPLKAAAALLAGGAGAWIARRLAEDREVSLTRAVLAGVIGTLLYDLTMVLDQRVLGRKFDTIGPLGEAFTDDPDLQPWIGWAAHYAAGVGLAVLYARFVHGRIPAPPVVQGAVFGAVDAATLAWGGLYPLLNRAAPHVAIPPGFTGLASSPTLTAQTLARHIAYGAGVGAVYRPPAPRFPA